MSNQKKIEIDLPAPQMPDTGEAKNKDEIKTAPVAMDQKKKRIYNGEITIESDLFRLGLAEMKKNMAWEEGVVDLQKTAHMHYFRTYDSDGKKQIYCGAIGGHFHKIDYDDSTDGVVRIKGISGPLHMVKRKIKRQLKTVIEPVPAYLEDNHTHPMEYIKSDTITARKANTNAIQMISQDAVKGTLPPGVGHGNS